MKPRQYLLVGFPYSGKTTVAKKLEEIFGFARVNIDDLKNQKGFSEKSDDDVPDQIWDEIFKEADALIGKYLSSGKSVVTEYAWINKEWRDRAVKAAEGYETLILYLNIPTYLVWNRWEENVKSKARFQLERNELERAIMDFEQLDERENFMEFKNSDELISWVKSKYTLS